MSSVRLVAVGIADEELAQEVCRHLGAARDVVIRSMHHFDDILLAVLAGQVDLLILDLDIQGVSGFKSVEVLRKACPNMKLIVLSPDPEIEKGRKILSHGIFFYGIKPIPKPELLAALDLAIAPKTQGSIDNV